MQAPALRMHALEGNKKAGGKLNIKHTMSLGGRFSIARATREGSSYGSFSTETKTPIHLLPEALGRKPMTGICGPGDLVHFSAWAKFLQPTEPLETGDLYMQTQYQ